MTYNVNISISPCMHILHARRCYKNACRIFCIFIFSCYFIHIFVSQCMFLTIKTKKLPSSWLEYILVHSLSTGHEFRVEKIARRRRIVMNFVHKQNTQTHHTYKLALRQNAICTANIMKRQHNTKCKSVLKWTRVCFVKMRLFQWWLCLLNLHIAMQLDCVRDVRVVYTFRMQISSDTSCVVGVDIFAIPCPLSPASLHLSRIA